MNAKHRWLNIGLGHACNGLKETVRTERNFRIHLIMALTAVAIAFLLHLPLIKWAIILILIGFVFVAEMINTVVERLLDYVKPNKHPQAKVIKDIAAGAVLVSAILAVVVGIIVFLPEFCKSMSWL